MILLIMVYCRVIVQRLFSTKMKLKEVTFTLGAKPMRTLLWCNKVPKGKRNKPSKINGIQHHEISESVEHVYYQPLN